MKTISATLIVASLLVSSQTGLVAQLNVAYAVSHVPLPDNGSYQRIVHGDLDGDQIADAVVLDGNVAALVHGPAAYQAHTELTTGVIDLDVLPRSGGLVGGTVTDAIVVLKSTGIWSVTWDGSAAVVTPIATPELSGSTMVRVVDLGIDLVVFVLKSDLKTMASMVYSGGVWSPSFSYQTNGIVHRMAGLDWNNDGVTDFVALTDLAIEPFELSGAPMGAIDYSGSPADMAVLRASSNPNGRDQVAVVVQDTAAWHMLIASSRGIGPSYLLSLPLGGPTPLNFEFTGIASGDIDGDFDDDVVIGQNTAGGYTVALRNMDDDGAAEFDPANENWLVQMGASPYGSLPGNDCPPSVADYDNDGRADVATPRDSVDALTLQVGISFDDVDGEGEGVTAGDFLHAFSNFDTESSAQGSFHLVMNLAAGVGDLFDFIQVVAWSDDESLQLPNIISPLAHYHGTFKIEKGSGPLAPTQQWLTIPGPVSGMPQEPTSEEGPFHYVVFRFFKLDAAGHMTEPSSPFKFGVAVDDRQTTNPNLLALSYASGANQTASLLEGEGPGQPQGSSGGRTFVGSIVMLHLVPPTSTGHPPAPGPITAGQSQVQMMTWESPFPPPPPSGR